jgi:tetratricopeptide (TPR) repeat protein
MWWYWFHRGHWREGRTWLEQALERGRDAPARPRAQALCGSGWLAWFQGDREQARARLEESIMLWREVGDLRRLGRALDFLSQVQASLGDLRAANASAAESVDILRRAGGGWHLGVALHDLGNVAAFERRDADAIALYDESAAILRAVPDPWALAMPLRNLAIVACRQRQFERAEAYCRESLASLRPCAEPWFVSRGLEEMALAACGRGHHRRAACLLGAAEALREAVGAVVLEVRRADYDRSLSVLRAALGEEQLQCAWRGGRAMSPGEAIAFALDTSGHEIAPSGKRSRVRARRGE